ncbi:hypothetical protein ACFE04_014701 [Oxalis oulophora]
MLRIAVVDDPEYFRNIYKKVSLVEDIEKGGSDLSISCPFSTRKSFSYSKLPEEPIELSVLKLDGSCFHIEVMQTAIVAELRQAVEGAFSHMPKKGAGKISWPHVWGHFCLCYEGQKLVFERDCINNYGMKEGDQLEFMRHVSSTCNLRKTKSKKKEIPLNHNHTTYLQLASKGNEENYNEEDLIYDDMEKGRVAQYYENDKDGKSGDNQEFGLDQVMKGWNPYSRVSNGGRTQYYNNNASPFRSSCDIFGSFKRFIGTCGGKRNSRRGTLRLD